MNTDRVPPSSPYPVPIHNPYNSSWTVSSLQGVDTLRFSFAVGVRGWVLRHIWLQDIRLSCHDVCNVGLSTGVIRRQAQPPSFMRKWSWIYCIEEYNTQQMGNVLHSQSSALQSWCAFQVSAGERYLYSTTPSMCDLHSHDRCHDDPLCLSRASKMSLVPLSDIPSHSDVSQDCLIPNGVGYLWKHLLAVLLMFALSVLEIAHDTWESCHHSAGQHMLHAAPQVWQRSPPKFALESLLSRHCLISQDAPKRRIRHHDMQTNPFRTMRDACKGGLSMICTQRKRRIVYRYVVAKV